MLNLIKRAWGSKSVAISAGVILAIAVIVMVIVIVMSIVAPVKSDQGDGAPTVARPVSTTAPAENTDACNVPVGDVSVRPRIPADLYWETAQGITWPVSPSVGPTKTKDGYPACFARSPLGAALMGVTLTNEQFRGHKVIDLLRFYSADSPGKSIALAQGVDPASAADMASAGITPAGFITDSFTPDEAHITLVLNSPKSSTGYIGMPYTFVWVDGDWRIKFLDSGEPFAGSPSAPKKGQFVEWRK